jgi:hypothetical protein
MSNDNTTGGSITGKRDIYLDTIARMEPEIAMVDASAALASIAISLKRIADTSNTVREELTTININLGYIYNLLNQR